MNSKIFSYLDFREMCFVIHIIVLIRLSDGLIAALGSKI